MKIIILILFVLLMPGILVCAEEKTTEDRALKDDVLYSRSMNDVEILAILDYEGAKIAIFRDKKTGAIHPLQVGNYLTHGKILRIDKATVRVSQKRRPDLQYSVYQKIFKNKNKEFISFSENDMDIRGLLANLATPAGKTVFVDKALNQKVGLTVYDLHWRDLLNIMALIFNFEVKEDDTAIRLIAPETINKTQGKK